MNFITLNEDEQKYAQKSIIKILPAALFDLMLAVKVLKNRVDILSFKIRYPDDIILFIMGILLRLFLALFKKIMLRRFYGMYK
tara:strand:- start:51 stop:299 length:249 start_codon:yes stop_codon:yes gene_type:complete